MAKDKLIAIRLSADGLAYIDRLAEQEGVNRSEMIRRLLREAAAQRRT